MSALCLAACSAGNSANNNAVNANTVGSTTINGVVYAASPLIGGSTIDPNHFWPPTGQDCTVQLGNGGQAPAGPPQAFLDECAGCHLPQGTGSGNFPDITGQHDYNALVATVRNGIQGGIAEMPAFKSTWLSDNDLKRIYAYLSQTPIVETGTCAPVVPMNADDIAAASQLGLAAWREFDGHNDPNGLLTNVACVQCHAPDPLDIAYYGYSDGDILRRGTAHLPASHIANIIDMVHGLRAQYHIGRRDPLAVRPFQPSSIVLQGNSIAERDRTFMQQLVDMNLIIATRPINTVTDANTAMNQVWNINRHTMPIPIPYDRYTEDQFHNPPGYVPACNDIDKCDDHGSIADWVSIVPHTMSDFNAYFARLMRISRIPKWQRSATSTTKR